MTDWKKLSIAVLHYWIMPFFATTVVVTVYFAFEVLLGEWLSTAFSNVTAILLWIPLFLGPIVMFFARQRYTTYRYNDRREKLLAASGVAFVIVVIVVFVLYTLLTADIGQFFARM